MALSTDEQQRLTSLQAAYDSLIVGGKPVRVSSGGRSVEYSAADLERLNGEIAALKARDITQRRRGGALRFRIT